MTPAQEVENYADWFGDSHLETVAYLRQYAALIKTYADAVAENVRLREAMDRYSEDEVLMVERCAKACEVMGFKHSECPEMSEYCADAIRTLKEKK